MRKPARNHYVDSYPYSGAVWEVAQKMTWDSFGDSEVEHEEVRRRMMDVAGRLDRMAKGLNPDAKSLEGAAYGLRSELEQAEKERRLKEWAVK